MEKKSLLPTIDTKQIVEFLNEVDAEKLCQIVKAAAVPVLCLVFGEKLIALADKAIDNSYNIDFNLSEGRFEMVKRDGEVYA